jgi:pterin-4a-carbinolamine dehydratase
MMKNGAVKLQRHPDIKVAYVTMVNIDIWMHPDTL